MRYEGQIFRPFSEANSYLLRDYGCSIMDVPLWYVQEKEIPGQKHAGNQGRYPNGPGILW